MVIAHSTLIEARVFQKMYTDKKWCSKPEIKEGNMVYLLTKNISMPKERSPLHSPTYSGRNRVIPVSPIGISGIPLIFFTMYFTLYRTILNGIVAYPAGGVTRIQPDHGNGITGIEFTW
jgi:hypothetical protein